MEMIPAFMVVLAVLTAAGGAASWSALAVSRVFGAPRPRATSLVLIALVAAAVTNTGLMALVKGADAARWDATQSVVPPIPGPPVAQPAR